MMRAFVTDPREWSDSRPGGKGGRELDMRRRCDRSFGLGPLSFFEGNGAPGAPAGDPPPAGAGGTPPPAPPATGAPAGNGEDRSNWIPRDRFDAVNGELAAIKKAEADRAEADLKAKGDHEKIAESEKAKREAAEARATNIARRAAFIGAAAGKTADPEAAYKLAVADGLIADLDVDDDGNAKDPKAAEKIVEEVTKRYEFLKPTKADKSFGGDKSGAGGGPELDPSKMSARDMLSAGYAANAGRVRGS